MTRSKSSSVKRYHHKSILKKTKGFKGCRRNTFKSAIRAYIKSLVYSRLHNTKYNSINRRTSIITVNRYINFYGLQYHTFIHQLRSRKVIINLSLLSKLFSIKHSIVPLFLSRIQGC